jgi:hypothetical protein
MGLPSTVVRLSTVAAVVLSGTGACALESPRLQSVAVAYHLTGASAPSGPSLAAAKPVARQRLQAAAAKGCPQGPNQRKVEGYLAKLGGFGKIKVDGRQSAADCAAIKKFQRRYGIVPPEGRAGPTTLDVSRRLASTKTSACGKRKVTTVCINLTQQTIWVMRKGKVIFKPTVTRTGMKGFRTPAGTFRINARNIREWSDPYKVWMPYWQHFHRGMGLHETVSYLHNMPAGSHGCVNLLRADAKALWKIGKIGTRVHTFGRRKGT